MEEGEEDDEETEIDRLLNELGVELPDVEEDEGRNGLPPSLDDLEEW